MNNLYLLNVYQKREVPAPTVKKAPPGPVEGSIEDTPAKTQEIEVLLFSQILTLNINMRDDDVSRGLKTKLDKVIPDITRVLVQRL